MLLLSALAWAACAAHGSDGERDASGHHLLDGALLDGALPDGALLDGALLDGALPDGALPDGALPDGALPDAALPDAAPLDAAPPDGAQPDAAQPDAALPDAALPDAAIPDASAGADSAVPADAGVPVFGPLTYERIDNFVVVDDLRRVRWHPGGDFALILGTGGKVVRYDAGTAAISLYATLGNDVVDLDVSSEGGFFLVVGEGSDGVGKLWRISVDSQGQLSHAVEAQLTFGDPVAIERGPDQVTWAIGSYASSTLSYLYLWQDGSGITQTVGFNASGGLKDLMWGDPGLYGGSHNVIMGCGINGADSKTYLVSSNLVVANAWPASYGNPGGAGWRPGGGFGMFTAWTTNKLYVFDGGWTLHTLPGVGTAASPNAVAWTEDGYRALIVGRAIGPGLSGTVIDFRPGLATFFNDADLWYASILSFDLTPWFANSNTHLQGVDWRPRSPCQEGLIVGSDNGTSLSPTFGLVIRYYDVNDPDCAPLP